MTLENHVDDILTQLWFFNGTLYYLIFAKKILFWLWQYKHVHLSTFKYTLYRQSSGALFSACIINIHNLLDHFFLYYTIFWIITLLKFCTDYLKLVCIFWLPESNIFQTRIKGTFLAIEIDKIGIYFHLNNMFPVSAELINEYNII